VKPENVDEHRAEKEQPQRYVSIGEQEQATHNLSEKDDDIEMRSENSSDELSRDALILGAWNKVQKTIQPEGDEDQAKENARDGDDVLHRLAPFVCTRDQSEAEFPSCIPLVVSAGRDGSAAGACLRKRARRR
jgi:hypothetical protein